MNLFYRHLIGWLIYPFFLFLFFSLFIYTNNIYLTIIHTITTLIFQMIIYYLNEYYILPSIYEKKYYFLYTLLNVSLLILGLAIKEIVDLYFDTPNLTNFKEILAHSVPNIITVFVSFVFYSFYKSKLQEEKELAVISAEKNFLIQQINPHFLFNTLNNIYSLTLDHDPKGSDAILQLSKMLDYSLYGGKKGLVSLKNEIDYIHNFITIFKLKDEEIGGIRFKYENVNLYLEIVPMLLIPFIENAFKHGNIENETDGYIYIDLHTINNELQFNCTNSYSKTKSIDQVGGIGIQNVSRRLELIYPKKHELIINKYDENYSVSLKITLK